MSKEAASQLNILEELHEAMPEDGVWIDRLVIAYFGLDDEDDGEVV